MRLIDAEDVIKYCCTSYGQCCHECEKCGFAKSVENIPTAYDVDKVVEELDMCSANHFMRGNHYDEGMRDAYDNAIDIVRRGGVDEL